MRVDFDPHGECEIEVVDDIIVIHAHGPWNLELSRNMHRQLAQVAEQYAENNTYLLICLKGEAIAGEDVINEHIKFIGYRRATAVALEFSQCSTTQITQNIFSRIYELTQQKYRFFDNQEQAMSWLKQLQAE